MLQEQLYTHDFYRIQKSGSYRSAAVIVPSVLEMLPVRSVCDVGCGVGTWLRCWREHGVEDVAGIDGDYVDRDQLMIPAANFRSADLRQPFHSDRRYDLAMSLEVAEHLPPERAAGFVIDLTSLAPVILFSAAVPGQGGTNHINERWQDYWADLFYQQGFLTLDVVRPKIWHNDDVEFWYRQNTLLFCHRDAVANYPGLTAAVTSAIPVVHPAHPMSTRESLSALRVALRRAASRKLEGLWPNGTTDGSA